MARKHSSLGEKAQTAYRARQKRKRRGAMASGTAEQMLAATRDFDDIGSHNLPMRRFLVLQAAEMAGYLKGEKTERVGGRVTPRLLSAAKARSGIKSQTELLEYALAKVALEDDYGQKLLARKGSVPDDVEL
jgi:hypothetical protein